MRSATSIVGGRPLAAAGGAVYWLCSSPGAQDMFQRVRRLLPLTALLTVTAWGTVADADHAWGSYHWKKPNAVLTLAVGDTLTGAWGPYFQTALDEIFKVKIRGIAFSELQIDGLHCILHPLPEGKRIRFELILCRSP